MTVDYRSALNERASCSVAVRWYVVSTYPQVEFQVFAALNGFRRYLPTIVTTRTLLKHGRPVQERGKNKVEQVLRPFFPGYLFAELDLDDARWCEIGRTQGVKRLLSTPDGRPLPVPVGFVEGLMSQGRAGDGAIDPDTPARHEALAPGAKVRVSGVFNGFDALVHRSAEERVWVLMELFGRQTTIAVPRASVKAIP